MVLLHFVALAAIAAEPICLRYGDDTQETKRSMTGAGHAIRFECPEPGNWRLTAIEVHGSRYGTPKAPSEDFKVVIANNDLTKRVELARPYRLFERGPEEWVRIRMKPVEVEGEFQVALFFNPTRTKGVYVGIDESSSPTHSSIVVPTEPDKDAGEVAGDWMIRAYVERGDSSPTTTLRSAEELARDIAQAEADRDAKLLGNARSLTLKHDEGKMDDHFNIHPALYTLAFDTPKNVECYVWQVQCYASQFGSQHNSEEVSGDVYILDEDRRILSRSTFPYSIATQQKEWIVIPTLPTKVKGRFYVSIDTHGNKYKGLYMGYTTGNPDKLATTDERTDDHIAPADWSEKFADKQWMIRVKVADRPVIY